MQSKKIMGSPVRIGAAAIRRPSSKSIFFSCPSSMPTDRSTANSLLLRRREPTAAESALEIPIRESRIRKAQEYLRTTNDSIETIAERVGYPDYFYFTKVYKKATGISPAAYRRQL